MKLFLIFFFILLGSSLTLAASNREDFESIELIQTEDDFKSVTIKDIKNYLFHTDTSKTCLDEMLRRRTQLLLKLAFIPITEQTSLITQAFGVNIFGFFLSDSITSRGGAVLAGFSSYSLGVFYSVASTGVMTTKTLINLKRLNLLMKALGEQYLQSGGVKSEKIYSLYLDEASTTPMGEDEFFERMIDLDRSGKLCDGSIVRKMPRIFKRTRSNFLKFRVASSKDFLYSLK